MCDGTSHAAPVHLKKHLPSTSTSAPTRHRPEHEINSLFLGLLVFIGVLGCVRVSAAADVRSKCVWYTDGWRFVDCEAVLITESHWMPVNFSITCVSQTMLEV